MSDFQFTIPKRKEDESESAEQVSSMIMSTSVMGSRNLTGKIVKRGGGGRSGSRERSGGKNSL